MNTIEDMPKESVSDKVPLQPPKNPEAWPYRAILVAGLCVAILNCFQDFVTVGYALRGYLPIGTISLGITAVLCVAAIVCLYSLPLRFQVDKTAREHAKRLRLALSYQSLLTNYRVKDNEPWGLSLLSVVCISLLSAIVVAIDLFCNQRAGLLCFPSKFDGIAYLLDAKRLYLSTPNPLMMLIGVLHFNYWAQHAYVWHAMLAISYYLFGAGEWQSYTARWWPTTIYLALIYWLVRKRSSRTFSIAVTLLTALLPIISPCIRAAAWDYATRTMNYSVEWYQDDLRPNFIFTVLIAVMVSLLLEAAQRPDWRKAALAGFVFGLGIFTKSTAIPELLVAALAASTIVIVKNWSFPYQWTSSAIGFILVSMPFCIVYAAIGGIEYTRDYMIIDFGRDVHLYSDPANAGLRVIPYYWSMITYQMGHWEWIFPTSMMVFSIIRKELRSLTFFITAIVIQTEIVLCPITDFFMNYAFILLSWCGACVCLSELSRDWLIRTDNDGFAKRILFGATAYCALLVGWGYFGLIHLEKRATIIGNLTRQVYFAEERDIVKYMRPGDYCCILSQDGTPTNMQFDWIGDNRIDFSSYRWYAPWLPYTAGQDPLPGWHACRLIIVYSGPMSEVAKYAFAPKVTWPLWDNLRSDLARSSSNFRLVKSYPVYPYANAPTDMNRPIAVAKDITLQVWVRKDNG